MTVKKTSITKKNEKISPQTVIRILKNYQIVVCKKKTKTKKEMDYWMGELAGVTDCICILMKKYDKKYYQSLKQAGMLNTVRGEPNSRS